MKKLPFAVLIIGMALSCPALADWGSNYASQAGTAEDPSVAYLASSSPVAVFSKVVDGSYRIYSLLPGASAPVVADEGIQADHRRPIIVPDGTGSAALLYSRFTGSAWHIFARRLVSGVFTDMNGGQPVDAGVDFNTMVSAGAYLGDGRLVVAFLQGTGIRMALYASECAAGIWTTANPATPVDDPASGYSCAVSMASMPDGSVALAYVQTVAGDARLFVLSYNGTAWTKLNGGAPLDRADLFNAARISAVARPNGSLLVTYLEENADGVSRIYGVVVDGAVMARVNAGAPLDNAVKGVNSAATAPVGGNRAVVVYGTADQVAGNEMPLVGSLLIDGTAVSSVNGGAAIQGGWDGAPAEVAVAGTPSGNAVMLFNVGTDGGSMMMGRAGGFTASASTGGAGNSMARAESGGKVSAFNPVFKPEIGETLKVQTTLGRSERVKLSLYSLSGGLVRVLCDSTMSSGQKTCEWNGTNNRSERVAAGVYILVAQGDTFRSMSRVAVIR